MLFVAVKRFLKKIPQDRFIGQRIKKCRVKCAGTDQNIDHQAVVIRGMDRVHGPGRHDQDVPLG